MYVYVLSEVRYYFEIINDLTTSGTSSFDAERKHPTETTGQVLLRSLVTRMIFQSRIRDPIDVLVLLQPSSKRQGIASMSFSPQAKRFETE